MIKKFKEIYESLRESTCDMDDLIYQLLQDRAIKALYILICNDVIKKDSFSEIIENFSDILFTEDGDDYNNYPVLDLIGLMIEKGFDVNMRDSAGTTIFHSIVSIDDNILRNKFIDLLIPGGMKLTNNILDYVKNDAFNGDRAFNYIEKKYPDIIKEYLKNKELKRFNI